MSLGVHPQRLGTTRIPDGAEAREDRKQVGSEDKSHRSRPAVCEEPGASARAISGMACARQSQVPSKGISELSHLEWWLSVSSQLPAA